MNLVVVGLLIGLWVWVLLPGLLRDRRHTEGDHATNAFADRLDTLAQASDDARVRPPGREIMVLGDPERVVTGEARSAAELRRRSLLARGGFIAASVAVVGVAFSGWWWTPLAVVGSCLLVYVALVVRLERRLTEQRDMLHDIAEERERRAPPELPVVDPEAPVIEVAVGDGMGIVVTGWDGEHAPPR